MIENWNIKLNKSINALIKKYTESTKSILTEGDLENLLYYYCKNNNLTIHSQITWFKDDRKSGFEMDLTILDENKLFVQEFDKLDKLVYNFEYPHKGYFYDGEIIGIEVKFIRKKRDLKKKILCDLIKINEKIIPYKKRNITKGIYNISNFSNVKFHIVIGFKQQSLLDISYKHVKRYLDLNLKFKDFVQVTLFCPDSYIKI